MKYTVLIYFILCICCVVLGVSKDEYEEETADEGNPVYEKVFGSNIVPLSSCWMTLNTAQHFKIMDEIDDRYAKIRKDVQETLTDNDFDQSMINGFIKSRGAALRELHVNQNIDSMIPSGLNLGGFCMMRVTDSILFFHRMKLRNNTFFRIDYLENDIANMVVRIFLSLNDLHLMGAYERALTDREPNVLIYAPTFGQVEFLLKNVRFKIEGRYRLISGRLVIEMISSEIIAEDVLMTYNISKDIKNEAVRILNENLGSFLSRLKVDMDKWLMDYFNDYMIYADMHGIKHMDDLAKYDKEKATALEEFADNAIDDIVTRLRLKNGDNIQLPMFTLKSIHGPQIKLGEGVLRGMDSMYRRSIVTGFKQRNIRKVDTIIGFSNLKVVYKYEAQLTTDVPPLTGLFTLSANELTAHLSLNLVNEPETIDLDIEFMNQMKPESLTVEGAANLMISNFRHLLEHQITALMGNTMIHGIRMMRTLPSCDPLFVSGRAGKEKFVTLVPMTTHSEYMTAIEQETVQPLESKNNDQNILFNADSQDKKALRSTKKPHTTSYKKESNENEELKKKLRYKNRRIKKPAVS